MSQEVEVAAAKLSTVDAAMDTLMDARIRLIELVPKAVETLESLLDAERDEVRLAAARDLLDRAGLSARTQLAISVDNVDGEIEALIAKLTAPAPVITLTDESITEDSEEDDDIADPELDEPNYGTAGTVVWMPRANTG